MGRIVCDSFFTSFAEFIWACNQNHYIVITRKSTWQYLIWSENYVVLPYQSIKSKSKGTLGTHWILTWTAQIIFWLAGITTSTKTVRCITFQSGFTAKLAVSQLLGQLVCQTGLVESLKNKTQTLLTLNGWWWEKVERSLQWPVHTGLCVKKNNCF